MPQQVDNGAVIMCTMGIGPGTLVVLPAAQVLAEGQPAATIMDYVPMTNIPPFPLCQAPANPTVIAATAAKLGVFSPAACVPATAAPWTPGASTVMIGNKPALDNASTCMCMYGGTISISYAGTSKTTVP
jgi:hypothetical protein